jgi:hypothetical protein
VKNPQPVEHIEEVRRLAGDKLLVFDPSESRFLENIIRHGDLCYMSSPAPLLMQIPGRLTMREYCHQAWSGDIKGAQRTFASVEATRQVMGKWVFGRWLDGRLPLAEIKAWGELLGFCSAKVRLPLRELSAADKLEMRTDLEKSGFLAHRRAA